MLDASPPGRRRRRAAPGQGRARTGMRAHGVWARRVSTGADSISMAGAQSYAQLDVCCNLSYVQIQDGRQSLIDETYSLMKISGLERRVQAYSMAQSRLAYE